MSYRVPDHYFAVANHPADLAGTILRGRFAIHRWAKQRLMAAHRSPMCLTLDDLPQVEAPLDRRFRDERPRS